MGRPSTSVPAGKHSSHTTKSASGRLSIQRSVTSVGIEATTTRPVPLSRSPWITRTSSTPQARSVAAHCSFSSSRREKNAQRRPRATASMIMCAEQTVFPEPVGLT